MLTEIIQLECDNNTLQGYSTAFQRQTKTTPQPHRTANLAGMILAARPCDSATLDAESITVTAINWQFNLTPSSAKYTLKLIEGKLSIGMPQLQKQIFGKSVTLNP